MCVRSALHDLHAQGVWSSGPIQHEVKLREWEAKLGEL